MLTIIWEVRKPFFHCESTVLQALGVGFILRQLAAVVQPVITFSLRNVQKQEILKSNFTFLAVLSRGVVTVAGGWQRTPEWDLTQWSSGWEQRQVLSDPGSSCKPHHAASRHHLGREEGDQSVHLVRAQHLDGGPDYQEGQHHHPQEVLHQGHWYWDGGEGGCCQDDIFKKNC